jgi:hypothetical protein
VACRPTPQALENIPSTIASADQPQASRRGSWPLVLAPTPHFPGVGVLPNIGRVPARLAGAPAAAHRIPATASGVYGPSAPESDSSAFLRGPESF